MEAWKLNFFLGNQLKQQKNGILLEKVIKLQKQKQKQKRKAKVEKGSNILERGQLWFHFDMLVESYEDNVVGACR